MRRCRVCDDVLTNTDAGTGLNNDATIIHMKNKHPDALLILILRELVLDH